MDATRSLHDPVWDGVLDELSLNKAKPTIAALSLTNRNLRLPAQRVLFRSLDFDGRTTNGELGTNLELVRSMLDPSNSRLREYVHRVSVHDWIPDDDEDDKAEDRFNDAAELKTIFREILSLLESFPSIRSLMLNHVTLENDTWGQLCAKSPNLSEVHVGYCEWNGADPASDTMPVVRHAVKDVNIWYPVDAGDCMNSGGRVQIPALLYTARTLIDPAQIERLNIVPNYGTHELLAQLACSNVFFLRLASFTVMCPSAISSPHLMAFLRLCPALRELAFNRTNYPYYRIQWIGPDQEDERNSIRTNSRALTEKSFAPHGLLPALKVFLGSADEAVAILNQTSSSLERLELHRTFQEGNSASHPLPKEAVEQILLALEKAHPLSRESIVEISCIDLRWDELDRPGTAEQEAARRISDAPQLSRALFPNLKSFSYRGPIDDRARTGS
ncbi:hypothetical protein BKA62DRAFT_775562 [Auriculariales sp. MPI-PUGE-AT-0066]|nr:hypothetical protein BKA62DRAFT_775562 [Auriculariales sp. MPI-PUGE-AT-0066]